MLDPGYWIPEDSKNPHKSNIFARLIPTRTMTGKVMQQPESVGI
jgi:hypothetical protein